LDLGSVSVRFEALLANRKFSAPHRSRRLKGPAVAEGALLQAPPQRVVRRTAKYFHRFGCVRYLEDAAHFPVPPTGATVRIFDVDVFGS
jgi:hypothetical protein